jgi:hypothetical protein
MITPESRFWAERGMNMTNFDRFPEEAVGAYPEKRSSQFDD